MTMSAYYEIIIYFLTHSEHSEIKVTVKLTGSTVAI